MEQNIEKLIQMQTIELAEALYYAKYEEVVSITSDVKFNRDILKAEPSVEKGMPFPLYRIPQLVEIVCDENVVLSHAISIREVKGIGKTMLMKMARKRLKGTNNIMKYLHDKFNIDYTEEMPFYTYAEFFMAGCTRRFSQLRTYIDDYVEMGYREIDVLLYDAGINYDFSAMEKLLQQGAIPMVKLKEDENDYGIRLTEMLMETRPYASCWHNPLCNTERTINHQDLCNLACWAAIERTYQILVKYYNDKELFKDFFDE